MAAATAEILRDSGSLTDAADAIDFPAAPTVSRPSAPAPVPPPANPITIPNVGSFSDAASAINPTFNAEQEAKQREIEQAKIRANAMRPEYANIVDATKTREGILAQLPKPPVLTPPPSLALRDFLATSENESPVTSITKMLQALSLFTNVAVGGSRHTAIGALAAFTGAMKGWHDGDVQRADRDYADWKAKSDTMLKDYEIQRQGYHDALTASGLSLEGKLRLANIKALELGDTQLVLALESGNLEKALGIMSSRSAAAQQYELEVAKIVGQRQDAEAKRLEATARLEETRASRDQRWAEHRERMEDRETAREDKRADAAAKAAEGKIMPAGEVEKLSDVRGFVEQLRDVRDAFNPSYTGPVKDWLKWAKSKSTGLPAQEEQFRAMLANFSNTLLKLRSGAAVTAQEYERLKMELPQTGDPPAKFLTKLETVIGLTERALATRQGEFRAAGYKVPDVPFRTRGGAAQTITLPDGTPVEVTR